MPPIKIKNTAYIPLLNKVRVLAIRHLYILLLIPILFYSYPILEPGISITGDFPYLETGNYAKDKLWLWIDKGSRDGFEYVTRLSIIGLWDMLGYIGITSELTTKVMVILGFSLSSFSFYFSFLLFFKNKFSNPTILKLSAIAGSLLYAYNVWSFNRIHHWHLWIGYSILPLFFVSIFSSFKNPKNWKYLLISTLLWSVGSSTPHMVIFYGIILVGTFLGFILNDLYKKRKPKIELVIPLLSIILFYILVNMYWIYPYILSSQIQAVNPPYVLTKDNLELLSREGSLFNSFRIMAYWLNLDVVNPAHALYSLWLISSFVIPIVAFSALFIKRPIKFILIFCSVALAAILLSMGTQSPIKYYNLALSIPVLSKFVWVFRDPDKWSFLITFAYSFLIGIVTYKVLFLISRKKKTNNKKMLFAGIFLFLLIGSIFLSSYPFYKARITPLKPILLPSEFDKLNAYLSTISTDKVYFIPYSIKEAAWDRTGYVQTIYQAHSIKPNIDSSDFLSVPSNYYNYLVSAIMENRSKNITNLINPLGTSYLIFHNDTWNKLRNSYDPKSIELLKKLYFLSDLKNVANIGFYKVFKTSNNNNNSGDIVREVNIPYRNIAVLGGSEILSSLNVIPSFNSLQSSIFFLDDIHPIDANTLINSFDDLILNRPSSEDEFALSFVDNKYVVSPSDNTISNDPTHVWSTAGARDPDNGEYHPYLDALNISNWDLDYGKGLVITNAMGDNLSIPFKVEETGIHDIFFRYMQNQKGGQIKIYLDGKLIDEVVTFDKISNNFLWKKISSMNLTEGKHILTLENVNGFNAVNIFALIPKDEMNRLRTETSHLLGERARLIYLLEAESNFNSIGRDIGNPIHLFEGNYSNLTASDNKSTFTKKYTGQFKVPKNSDLVYLQFLSKNPNNESSYSIKNVEITPAYKKYDLLTLDFERKNNTAPLAALRHSDLLNLDKDLVSTSTETKKPLHGNQSLRVDLKSGVKVGWNTLTTDLIPIANDTNYKASFDVSAKDVKQFHSKILYFDSKQQEIKRSDQYILDGKDGTFEDSFSSALLPPKGAKYLKYQILTRSANQIASYYILDNVNLEETIIPNNIEDNNIGNLGRDGDQKELIAKKVDSFERKVKDNSTISIMQTNPTPVREDHTYNYTVTLETKNASSYSANAVFRTSSDVTQNPAKYGNNASNGDVLALSPGSKIHATLDIIKPSNYTIALRAKTCESCTFLKVDMNADNNYTSKDTVDSIQTGNISLRNNNSELKWLYSNTTYALEKGTYELKIYSDSQTDLDSVLIYPVDNNNSSSYANNKNHNRSLEDLFTLGKNSLSPAQISEYKKINPTKHIINIKNATRPYMLAFAESYDPLWTAYTDTSNYTNNQDNNKNYNFKTNSIPLYGLINGFYVNKTGNYSLIIEYEPQKLFSQGLIISVFSLAAILVGFLLLAKHKVLTKSCVTIIRTIRRYTTKA
jgi:hypothetical protein